MKKMICAYLSAVFLSVMIPVGVSAEEVLPVSVTSYDGSSVLMSGDMPLWSAVPVTFTGAHEGEFHYSISIDDGENFGGYDKSDTGSVTLYPDDDTAPEGRWQIRFKSVDENGSETFSDIYRVCFDTVAPAVVLENKEALEETGAKRSVLRISASDDKSGIGRIIAKNRTDVVFEKHFRDGEVAKETTFEINPNDMKEGENTVEVTCFDIAGNSSCLTFEYVFDNTPPTISVDGIGTGDCLSSAGELRASAFDDSGIVYLDYVIERRSADEVITTDVSGASADTTLSFDRDGKYVVTLFATDGAGNRSREETRKFTIDKSAPEVFISGADERAGISFPANITVEVRDEEWEDTEVNISLKKLTPQKTEDIPIPAYNLMASEDARTVNITSDGEYVLEAVAKDGAGNTSSRTQRFRIDSNAPGISVGGIADGDVTADLPVLKFAAAELFYDSTVMSAILEKKEKDGYRKVAACDRLMRSQEDLIEIAPKEEGQYRLTCVAADAGGNSSQVSVNFTVDQTPPVISKVSGLNNRFFRSFTLPARICEMVSDRLNVKAFARINDRLFDEKESIVEEGKYVFTILAEDEAGNAAEESATFIVDHTAPQIVLKGFDRDGNIRKGSMLEVGLLDEADTLVSVRFNDRNVVVDKDNTAHIAVTDYGEYDLEVTATDEAENKTDTVIHASCYMDAPLFAAKFSEKEKIFTKSAEKKDTDPLMLTIGMISVLSGTYGLTYRATLRD